MNLVRFKSVGNRIQDLRHERGYTQESFAEILGFTVVKMRNIEQGRTAIPVLDLEKIADLLGCDIDYLLGRQEEPNRTYKHISDLTGLSYEAAELLSQNNGREDIFKTTLSWLIENPSLIRDINSAARSDYADGYVQRDKLIQQKDGDYKREVKAYTVKASTLYAAEKLAVTESAMACVNAIRKGNGLPEV